MNEVHPYFNRIIKFEYDEECVLNEIHFDKKSNTLLDRVYRKNTLPQFRFDFPEHQLWVEIKHQFLDEMDFAVIEFEGINIETITSELFDYNGKSKSLILHTVEINKEPYNYLKIANQILKQYQETIKSNDTQESFLKDEYQQFNPKEKVDYLYGQILFEDRMQGGYPSKYKYPVASYVSKWFVDSYGKYDSDYPKTIATLLDKFNLKCADINEMLKYETTSSEWIKLAIKNQLLN